MTATAVETWNVLEPAQLQFAHEILAGAFGTPFEFWTLDASQREFLTIDDRGASQLDSPSPEIAPIIKQALRGEGEPIVQKDHFDFVTLAAPISKFDHPVCAAVASFRGHSVDAVANIARVCLREIKHEELTAKLEQENQAMAHQVNQDFEELNYLRNMSEHFQALKLTNSVERSADFVLPLMCETIGAECVVFLTPTESEDSQGQLQIASQTGRRIPAETSLQHVVEHFGEAAHCQPVVRNNVHRTSLAEALPHIRSLILVPVEHNNCAVGWICAINRSVDSSAPQQLVHGNSTEFGTCQAGIVASTATFLASHAANVESFREKERLLVSVVRALVSAVEAKDEYTCGHSERVALFSRRLAREVGYSSEASERIYLSGLLHDIGKIGIRDAVLSKPGRLTDEEFGQIKSHPELGFEILSELEALNHVFAGVLHHHERFDGKGYPDGLKGDDIPLDARILAVVDTYDAMTSDRPYRKGMPDEKAEAILRGGAGSQWDAAVVEAFFRALPDLLKIRHSYQQRSRPERKPSDGSA